MVRNVVLPAILATVAPAVSLDEAENVKVVSFPFLLPSSPLSSQPQSFASRSAFNKHCFGFVDSAVQGAHAVSAEKLATRVLPLCRGDATQCQQWSSDLWSVVADKMQVGEYSQGVQKISTRLVAGPQAVTNWCKEVYSTNLGIDLPVHPAGQEPNFTPQVEFDKPSVKSVPRAVVASTSDVKTVEPESHQAESEAVTTAAPTTTAVSTTTERPTTTAVPVASTTVPAKLATTTSIVRHETPQSMKQKYGSSTTAQVITTTSKVVIHEVPTTTSTQLTVHTTTAAPAKVSSAPVRPSIAKLAEKAAAKLAAKHAAAKIAKPIAKQASTPAPKKAKVVPTAKTSKPAGKVEVQPAAQHPTPAQPASKLVAKPSVPPSVQPAVKAAPQLPATSTAKPALKVSSGEQPVMPVAKADSKFGAPVPLLRKASPVIAAAPKTPVAVAATAAAHATKTADTAVAKEECVCVERDGTKTCHCHTPGSHKKRRYGSR